MLQDLISKLLPMRTTMKNDHPDAYIMQLQNMDLSKSLLFCPIPL